MGWTSYHATHYKNGKVDKKAECDAYWTEGLNAEHFEVVKSSMVGNVYYGAIKALLKRNGKDENGKDVYVQIPKDEQETFAVVFLTSIDNKDYYNFSYKNMDETMLPYNFDCPIGILNLLSKTDNEYALEWRKKCYDKHNEKSREKKNPNSLKNLPVNSRISFVAKYETSANNVGDEIILTKIEGYHGKAYWYGYGYKWNEKIIKSISNGVYKVLEEK